ncbi:MAG TPA: zinc ribbon domain-containing protein [Desulfotomaculum sp.]|nr:MAG: Regulatory protein, FmdB family [Desulfotomaculum sp. 46_80]HAG11754.1 zinc ribbon domain-containing protein [Desulfotomaculum sp.]HBY05134.1 zinc ribbon domain-containing protein [Desulfotomaculum sp.]
MPVYEFKCMECESRFERLCQIGETGQNLSCPKCGKPEPYRVMSSFETGGKNGGDSDTFAGSSGGCAGCSSGNCATCGH